MDREDIRMIKMFGGLVIAFLLVIAAIAMPPFILTGMAKSEYLREQRGIDMSWPKAAFLPDSLFIDLEAKVETTQE